MNSVGIPENSMLRYKTALKTGKDLPIAHGSMDDTAHANELINRTLPKHCSIISKTTNSGSRTIEAQRNPNLSQLYSRTH